MAASALLLRCLLVLGVVRGLELSLTRRDAWRRTAAAAVAGVVAPAAPALASDGAAAIAVDRVSLGATISQGYAGKNYAKFEDTINGPKGSKKVVNIAFEYPRLWTSLKNSVDLIDGKTGTVATVVAAPLKDGLASLDSKSFYNCIFSPDGKIQKAGTPVDEYKVLSVKDAPLAPSPNTKEVSLKFTAARPAASAPRAARAPDARPVVPRAGLAERAPHRPAGDGDRGPRRRHGLHLRRLRRRRQVEGRAADGGDGRPHVPRVLLTTVPVGIPSPFVALPWCLEPRGGGGRPRGAPAAPAGASTTAQAPQLQPHFFFLTSLSPAVFRLIFSPAETFAFWAPSEASCFLFMRR